MNFIGELQTERKLSALAVIKEGGIFRVGMTRLRLGGAKNEHVAARAAATGGNSGNQLSTLPVIAGKNVLIFATGNESRGDDALAPLLLRRLHAEGYATAEFIEDYQLQVEHVTDLAERSAVLFVDADVSCDAPFHFSEIVASQDHSYTSHAMTPFALLHTYRQVYGADAPPAFLLRIRGYDFELGNPLSADAAVNLEHAVAKVYAWLADIPAMGNSHA